MRCGIAAVIFALLALGNPAAGQQITSPGANVFLTSFILATNYGVSTGGTGASNLANLLSALTAGCAINGATVVQLPPGTFTIDGVLWPANCRNLTLKGSGNAYSYGDPANSSTVIKIGKPLSGGYGIKVPSSGAQPVFIEDVTIDCNGVPYGIRAFGQTLLRRVRVIHCTSAGIRGNGLNQARFQEVSSRDNRGDGLLIDQDPDASGIPSTIYHIEDSEFRQNGGNGLTIRSANNAVFENIVSEGNGGFGLDVNWQAEPVTQTRFDNLWLEHNALNGSSVYYLRITSANIAGGPNSWAQALVFRNLKINNVGGGVKSINVQAVLGLTIADASFPQDATGIIDLDTTNAQHIVF